ncbi:MAG: histidinol-phosphate transaminase, partial [Candidatus Hecatellales archaeon]
PPNSVSLISLALAKLALDKIDFFLEKVREVVAERDRMAEILGRLKGLTVYPSKANFLLIRFKTIEASQVYRMLLSRGMVVRRVRGPLLENCLRITVLDRASNDKLIGALKEILGEQG